MATQSSSQSVATAASVLFGQNTPQLGARTAAPAERGASAPNAGAIGTGTELVAGNARGEGIGPEGEIHAWSESADRTSNGESYGLRLSAPLERMPVSLSVSIPVRDFRVRNLLAMRAGELIETQWVNGEDLPLASRELQLAWCEFEVVDTRLAVRLTRLA